MVIGSKLSDLSKLLFGVPQSSVLDLFPLHYIVQLFKFTGVSSGANLTFMLMKHSFCHLSHKNMLALLHLKS